MTLRVSLVVALKLAWQWMGNLGGLRPRVSGTGDVVSKRTTVRLSTSQALPRWWDLFAGLLVVEKMAG